jgi:hypothetical protein
LNVELTRRRFLGAAGSLVLPAILPEAALSQGAITGFKATTTTVFWVGEPADHDNDFIPNDESYWDKDWQTNYGGFDDPRHRNGHWPADFRPQENPFYAALPYGEFAGDVRLKRKAQGIPWYQDVSPAVWHYLGMNENGLTEWRFIAAADVPSGPWTEIVTISGNNR